MTIEEIQARQAEIKSRLQEIDSEFSGEELPAENRSEWNKLNEEFDANGERAAELIARRDRVEALAGSEENRESGASFQIGSKPGAVKGDDIYDLSTVRSSVSGPQEATRELKDRAKRSIEEADFAHENANREDSQAHIEKLMSRKDGQLGEVSRRILMTGSPVYRRAFQKKIAGQELSPEDRKSVV